MFQLVVVFFQLLIMMGLLGILGWKVTVISSNFIALMLILTMAMNIHMSTRFLQLREDYPNLDNFEIIYFNNRIKCFGLSFIQFLQLYLLFYL